VTSVSIVGNIKYNRQYNIKYNYKRKFLTQKSTNSIQDGNKIAKGSLICPVSEFIVKFFFSEILCKTIDFEDYIFKLLNFILYLTLFTVHRP
jgi:hypothetical protein